MCIGENNDSSENCSQLWTVMTDLGTGEECTVYNTNTSETLLLEALVRIITDLKDAIHVQRTELKINLDCVQFSIIVFMTDQNMHSLQ